ncbi:MAG: flavodoxin [Deltaproteobacteria bacterium]|nr:flavodoxin [Deltaproteobacteria bacterium]
MKKLFILFAAVAFFFALGTGLEAQEKKILIAYYSLTNNTKNVALEIQRQTGGDLFQIETVATYPDDYEGLLQVVEKERNDNARPELKAKVDNIESYDVIFIGYPAWFSDLPPALYTFLESYDLTGKTIAPFCTHGTAPGDQDATIKRLQPNATVLETLKISGNTVKEDPENAPKQPVSDWLSKIGVK